MLYELVRKKRGRETVMMRGSLPAVNARLRLLRASGQEGAFAARPAASPVKFKKRHRHRSH